MQCLSKLPHDSKIVPVVDRALSQIPPLNPNSSYFDGGAFLTYTLLLLTRLGRYRVHPHGPQRFGEYEFYGHAHCSVDLPPQIHNTGFFLPWHRLYVQNLEDKMRSKCGYDGVQPYWDWTKGNISCQDDWMSALTKKNQIRRTFTTRRSFPTLIMTVLGPGVTPMMTSRFAPVASRISRLPTPPHTEFAGILPFTFHQGSQPPPAYHPRTLP